MRILIIFCLVKLLFISIAFGQDFDKFVDKDSLLQVLIKKLPEDKKKEVIKTYKEGNEQIKEYLLFMLSMPTSSRKELMANIDSNITKIIDLKIAFTRLVPNGYIVSIEFNPADRLVKMPESIDLKIEHKNNGKNELEQEWNLEYNSKKLGEMLESVNWTINTIIYIKRLLSDANCISIENGEITTIGFARSGMGKYSFKLFNNDLSAEEIEKYNDGCTYIYYRNNIVLEFGGGAVGPQCFPD